MIKKIISLFRSEDGATAIEYGLIAALIAIVAIAAMKSVGLALIQIYTIVGIYLR